MGFSGIYLIQTTLNTTFTFCASLVNPRLKSILNIQAKKRVLMAFDGSQAAARTLSMVNR